MSTPTPPRPLSSDSLIGRLVPFIDGELAEEERAAVEAELVRDPELRAIVEEQVAVRGVLRGLAPASAPQGLAARIRLELDAVDREVELGGPIEPEVVSAGEATIADLDDARRRRGWPRVAGFLRGALVMVPAAAAAALLFAVTRYAGPEPTIEPTTQPTIAATTPNTPSFAADGVPVIIGAPPRDAAPRGDAPGVSLAGLADLDADDPTMPEVVEYTLDDRGTRVVDVRRPAAVGPLPGAVLRYQDHEYHAVRDRLGRVLISFTVDGTTHVLVPASASAAAEPQRLLELAHALRTGAGPR